LNNKIKNTIKYISFLSIGAVLLYFAFKDIPLDKFLNDVKNANWFWIAMNILFGILAFISRALRWRISIEPLGYKPKNINSFYALMTGYLANMAFPRLGEITRCSVLYKTDKIPVAKLLGSVIVERALDLLILIALMIFVFFYKINFFGKFIYEKVINPFLLSLQNKFGNAGIIYYIIIAITITSVLIIYYNRKKLKQLSIYTKIKKLTQEIVEGLKVIYTMKKKTQYIIHTFLIWFFYILMTYSVFFAIPETADLNFADAIFVLVFGGIGMALPVQGGFGTYHAIVALSLTIYKIPYESGLVFATISHEAQTILVLITGGISAIIVSVKK
jgi:uncharacterized protein (TIRG00374 family)